MGRRTLKQSLFDSSKFVHLKKILHILATPRSEGTPNLVLDWLSTGACQQEVFAIEASPADLTELLKSSANWYGEADDGLLKGWREFPRITARIRQVCAERKPDLVICWPTGLSAWMTLGARLAGVPQVLVHSGNPPTRGVKADWITRYVFWPLALMQAKVICCSQYVRDEFLAIPAIPKGMLHAVHNCSRIKAIQKRVRLAQAQMGERKRHQAVMVATLENHKDHETLLMALPLVLKVLPDFRIDLVGDGSLRGHLESRVQQLGLKNVVSFLGTRQDVPEILARAELFVFSTTPQEGLGSVLLEALAAGLPIVASDVPACREILGQGKWGVLVPPLDPDKLAQGMIQRWRAPIWSEDWQIQCDEYLDGFSPQRMLDRYLSIADEP